MSQKNYWITDLKEIKENWHFPHFLIGLLVMAVGTIGLIAVCLVTNALFELFGSKVFVYGAIELSLAVYFAAMAYKHNW